MMDRLEYINSKMGKPYRLDAMGPDEYGCWGFAIEVQRVLFGKILPVVSVPENSARKFANELQQNDERLRWMEVAKPQDGAMVLMSRRYVPIHVGVWLDLGSQSGILHCVEPYGVVLDDLIGLQANLWPNAQFYIPRGQA